MLPTSECVPDCIHTTPASAAWEENFPQGAGWCSLKLLQPLFVLFHTPLPDTNCAFCSSTVSLLFAHRYEVDDIDEEGKE